MEGENICGKRAGDRARWRYKKELYHLLLPLFIYLVSLLPSIYLLIYIFQVVTPYMYVCVCALCLSPPLPPPPSSLSSLLLYLHPLPYPPPLFLIQQETENDSEKIEDEFECDG